MGRPLKPSKLKLLQGTARKCRMNQDEPDQSAGLPQPPPHLSKVATEHFNTLVSRIDEMGYASDSFTEVLALAASAFDTWQICEGVIEKMGIIIMIPGACDEMYPKEHPAVSTRQKTWQTYRMCLVELGLTPASKSKVSAKKKETEKKGKWAL